MAENSNIEWTDHTWNPWMGCTAISPACDNCYAERLVNRFGDFAVRKRTGTDNWEKPGRWNRAHQKFFAEHGRRQRVFCLSLGDFFDNQVPTEWRDDAWEVIRNTPNLDWQILTKRPQNIKKFLPSDWGDGYPNVWLGATAESDEYFINRWRYLRDIAAPVHFISYEPALGPLRLPRERQPDWIICGGESAKGPHRPMDLQWARNLRDDCKHTGTAFFMKQIDKKQPIPDDLLIREFPGCGGGV